LTKNVNGAAIASGLMTAALFDFLIVKGLITEIEASAQLKLAAGFLGNDFTGRPDEYSALRVINSVVKNLASDSQ
jgi:hypothetical protein